MKKLDRLVLFCMVPFRGVRFHQTFKKQFMRKQFEIFDADFFADNINGAGHYAHMQMLLRQSIQATK